MFINVTPCVGVWIETKLTTKKKPKYWSHPAWVCGLKPNCLNGSLTVTLVTPCVGVWIETKLTFNSRDIAVSHPAWVCGLKLYCEGKTNVPIRHTLRGCVD